MYTIGPITKTGSTPETVTTVKDRINDLYLKNYPGTFAGCLEILNQSLHEYIDNLAIQYGPGLIFDDYPQKISFLYGNTNSVRYYDGYGKMREGPVTLNERVISTNALNLLISSNRSRNHHVHKESIYPLIERFEKVVIQVNHDWMCIFNPNPRVHGFVVDESGVHAQDAYTLVFVKAKPKEDMVVDQLGIHGDMQIDLISAEFNDSSMMTEIRTSKNLLKEFPEAEGSLKSGHYILVYYGTLRIFLHIKRREELQALKDIFQIGTVTNSTFYYRFKASSLMNRIFLEKPYLNC